MVRCKEDCSEAVAAITSVIDQLNDTRTAQGDAGQIIDINTFALRPEAGAYLEASVDASAPQTVLEVGCASALGTLHMARALTRAGALRPQCIHVMDPKQTTHWKNIGRRALAQAGLDAEVVFYEEPAHVVLPRLLDSGVSVQFCMIDGWHMLDFVMLESFYCDLMLDVGGVIAHDDLGMPAIQQFCAFWTANRAYEPIALQDGRLSRDGPPAVHAPDSLVARGTPFFLREIAPFVHMNMLLLRKCADDTRRWDFYRDFST